jgi:hypothetical protein
LGKEWGVGDNEAEVDVDGRGDAGLELEATELHGRDLVELEDQGLHRRHIERHRDTKKKKAERKRWEKRKERESCNETNKNNNW